MKSKSTFISKLVNILICSDIHPQIVKMQNAWVVENLHLPEHQINPEHLKNKFSYLKEVNFPFVR